MIKALLKKKNNEPAAPDRPARRLSVHLAMSVREIYDAIDQEPDRPEAMAPFDALFKKFADDPAGLVSASGRKVVGVYCMTVPEELIYAAGALPVRLCAGSGEAAEAGEAHFPDVCCPMVTSAAGFTRTGALPVYRQCDLVVIPATCDWKTKLGAIIGVHVPVMMLGYPKCKEEESSRLFWYEEVRRLTHALERLTGRRITRQSLRNALSLTHKASAQFRELQSLRAHAPSLIRGRDAAAVANAWFYMDAARWTEAVFRLNGELRARKPAGPYAFPPSSPRILLTGSPVIFPNWKIPGLIEGAGGALMCDELCSSGRMLWDMACVDEPLYDDMLDALADRCLLPCTCPVFTNMEDRKTRLLAMIRDFRVEGVIHHVLKGCHPYDLEFRLLETELAKADVSQLKIETDYTPEDSEQLRTRIEAFIETLKGRRIRSNHR